MIAIIRFSNFRVFECVVWEIETTSVNLIFFSREKVYKTSCRARRVVSIGRNPIEIPRILVWDSKTACGAHAKVLKRVKCFLSLQVTCLDQNQIWAMIWVDYNIILKFCASNKILDRYPTYAKIENYNSSFVSVFSRYKKFVPNSLIRKLVPAYAFLKSCVRMNWGY